MHRATVLLASLLLASAAPAVAQCHLPMPAPARDAAEGSRYAQDARWYVDNEVVAVHDRRYVKYGLPRAVAPGELEIIGSYEGVPLYVETGATKVYVLYLLANERCEVQPYEAHLALFVVRSDSAPPPGTAPAVLRVTGCPRGAELYLFPATELGGPRWRAKLRRDSARYLGRAQAYSVLVPSDAPRPYDVVLQWHTRVWRFRVDAVPGRTAEVHARPPSLLSCTVPVYPTM
jgi:hypothetical protein